MFNEQEAERMAANLQMSVTSFYDKYARKLKSGWSLRERKTRHGHDCILLDRETQPGKALCRVYKERPTQCRTWPFWPDNLKTRQSWASARDHTPCPGMDRGRLIPIDQIRIQRKAMEEADRNAS